MRYTAIYYDGITAQRQIVTVRFKGRKLVISDPEKRVLASWPIKKVMRVHPVDPMLPLRLCCKKQPNARLIISDQTAISVVSELLPILFKEGHSGKRLLHIAVVLALVTSTLLSALYFAIPKLAKPIAQAIPFQVEQQIGKATHRSLVKTWPLCQGEGALVLQRLADRLGLAAQLDYPVNVQIVRADVMNAFAMPGGYILMTDKLIAFMESPDELAGVLAHEIGHVVLRHPLEEALSQMGLVLTLNALTGGGSSELVGLGTLIAAISYTRDYEREADKLGLKILQSANISVHGYARLFDRMLEQGKDEADDGSVFDFRLLLRSHPYANERAALARGLQDQVLEPFMTPEDWQSLTAVCGVPPDGGKTTPHDTTMNGRVDRE